MTHKINKNNILIDNFDFEELYNDFFPKLIHFAQGYSLTREEAENIIQDVFQALWESRFHTRIHTCISSYLFVLTKNRCIDLLRQKSNWEKGKLKIQNDYESDLQIKLYRSEEFNPELNSGSDIEQFILSCMDTLPPKCREIFIQNKIEEKSYKEIAREMQISVKTVENQLNIARRKLREKLSFLSSM